MVEPRHPTSRRVLWTSIPALAFLLAGGTAFGQTEEEPPPEAEARETAEADDEAREPKTEAGDEAAGSEEAEAGDEAEGSAESRASEETEARPTLDPERFSWAVVSPAPSRRWVGEPISLSLRDADLVEVLRSFAKMTGVNLIIDPGVKGSVTVELKDVPWDQALDAILKSQGLGMEVSGNVWSVAEAERLHE